MAVLQDLLEYQRIDAELRKLEQTIASSEERKRLVQAKNGVKNAETQIAAEDARAAEIVRLRAEIAARVEEAGRAVAEYEDVDELVAEGGGDVSFYKRNAQQLAEKLRAARAELNRLLNEAEALSKEYARMMEQGKQKMADYKEYSKKFGELQESHRAEREAILARLDEAGKKLPPAMLERYRQKRNEHIFPVIVPLAHDSDTCVCGMDLALAQKGKLTGGNVIECENCHRFIYKS